MHRLNYDVGRMSWHSVMMPALCENGLCSSRWEFPVLPWSFSFGHQSACVYSASAEFREGSVYLVKNGHWAPWVPLAFRSQAEVWAKGSTWVPIESWLYEECACYLIPQGNLSAIVMWDTGDIPTFPPPYLTYMQISDIATGNLGHSREES